MHQTASKCLLKQINDLVHMKKLFLILLSLALFENANAQLYGIFKDIGKIILFADSLKIKDESDFQIDQIKNDKNANRIKELDSYNLAICFIAKNEPDSTFLYLNKSIEQSPNYNLLILADSDFRYLHKTPGWIKIMSKIDSLILVNSPPISNPQLASELLKIRIKDQYARGFGLKFKDTSIRNYDRENLSRLEKIINEYGWPTYSMTGKLAADAAFLIIQHSDTTTQIKYLDQILDAAKRKEASLESVALLLDRLSVQRNGTQIYGSQVFQLTDPQTGKLGNYAYFPIVNETEVDKRRQEFGMIPLKDYLKLFGIDYVPGTKDKNKTL